MDSQREGKLDVDGKDYLKFLLQKYGYKTIPNARRVANDKNIPAEDKVYMVSCLQNPYLPNFSLKKQLEDLAEMRKVPGYDDFKRELLLFEPVLPPAPRKPGTAPTRSNTMTPPTPTPNKPIVDNTSLPGERSALDNLLDKTGSTPLGGLLPLGLIAGSIYLMFSKPKLFFSALAALGVYAYNPEFFQSIAEKGGNKLDNYKEDAKTRRFNENSGGTSSPSPFTQERPKEIDTNAFSSKKENIRTSGGLEKADKNNFDAAYSGLSSSKEFGLKSVASLQTAYEKKNLDSYFGSIKEIGGVTGAEFYKRYSATKISSEVKNTDKNIPGNSFTVDQSLLETIVGRLLETKDAKDTIVRDLFTDGQAPLSEQEKPMIEIAKMRS